MGYTNYEELELFQDDKSLVYKIERFGHGDGRLSIKEVPNRARRILNKLLQVKP